MLCRFLNGGKLSAFQHVLPEKAHAGAEAFGGVALRRGGTAQLSPSDPGSRPRRGTPPNRSRAINLVTILPAEYLSNMAGDGLCGCC